MAHIRKKTFIVTKHSQIMQRLASSSQLNVVHFVGCVLLLTVQNSMKQSTKVVCVVSPIQTTDYANTQVLQVSDIIVYFMTVAFLMSWTVF